MIENGVIRLQIGQGFVTEVRSQDEWRVTSHIASRPIDSLLPTEAHGNQLGGCGEGYQWQTVIQPAVDGFWLDTVLHAERTVSISPAMILWLGALDNMQDRQGLTWRQTILRGPTINQQGLPGNDLAAGYFYDPRTQMESMVYFPAGALAWAKHRLYHFSVREVLDYRFWRYGMGLVPNAPESLFELAPGRHEFRWWFTQRLRQETPTVWEAQRLLVDALAPLLDTVPSMRADAPSWQSVAESALNDLEHEACWVTANGRRGLRAYVRGSSSEKRDEAQHFELMTQLDVLWPLMLWRAATADKRADPIIQHLSETLPLFARRDYVANPYPPHGSDTFMDTWYFFENALIKLPWVAHLSNNVTLQEMFLAALDGAKRLARNTNSIFPLFADASSWQARGSLLNMSVGGMYAGGCILASQFTSDFSYLDEAARALHVLSHFPPQQLTHEPQQLSFAAASAAYLARIGYGDQWGRIASDFVRAVLRMGYWDRDPAVPFYDPRGMFQACAALCYPAFKENVEVLLAWPELLLTDVGPRETMVAFANLQRCHNYAFFERFVPKTGHASPCAFIPYEDLPTAEFDHLGDLGKELYGTGEVFWSALLFDTLGRVDDPAVLCLCLDVPCLELHEIPAAEQRRYLLYNPTGEEKLVTLRNEAGERTLVMAPRAVQVVEGGMV